MGGEAVSDGDPRFLELLDELRRLHQRKSADYGRGEDFLANFHASAGFGVPPWKAALVRLNDKVERLKAYCANGKLANEGVEDTLMDMAAYSLLVLILHREEAKT